MSTITRGANGRTNIAGASERTKFQFNDDARFSKVETVTISSTQGVKHLTGSLAGTSGFIVTTAGQGVITAVDGGDLNASDLTAKQLYEIGVRHISGACTVQVVY
tara:strand:- start:9 stop:323 length:315 start_codon:yes stop_codon:yes gene_type:complete